MTQYSIKKSLGGVIGPFWFPPTQETVKKIGPADLDAIGVLSAHHRAFLLDAVRVLKEQVGEIIDGDGDVNVDVDGDADVGVDGEGDVNVYIVIDVDVNAMVSLVEMLIFSFVDIAQ